MPINSAALAFAAACAATDAARQLPPIPRSATGCSRRPSCCLRPHPAIRSM